MVRSLRILWLTLAGAGVLGALLGFSDGYVLIVFAFIGAIADAMPIPDSPSSQALNEKGPSAHP
ncbi:hypothetical protein [Marinobacter salsuginis]|uniref:Uncharacterized protein n=1 Tax=Marinobacter salsuginis TaxID=418719 RepID=A0A5M3Q4J5_9GAMM|nr:hypothetical protein [Marinobacter salsuginis]GBO90178.1 hypothetical protein MSSD14B_38460 [Marinobacter salsuginis]